MPVNASSPAAPAEQWRPTAADLPALALGVALAAAMLSFTFHTFETAGLSFTLRNIDQTKWLALAGAETEGWKRAHRKTDLLRHKTLEAVVVAVEVTTV